METVRNGLAIYSFGRGQPMLFMPYPHAVSVVGDAVPGAIIKGLVELGREVITFDPPGSGRSTRPMQLTMDEMLGCAEEALRACGVAEQVDLLGHSQGGMAALAFALHRPEQVSRLVLVCSASGAPAYLHAPGAIWNRSHPDFWRMSGPASLYWLTRRQAPHTLMLNVILRASWVDQTHFHARPVAPSDWLRPAPGRTWWGQVARRLDYSRRLAEVTVPTLIVAGRYDPQMPTVCGEELATHIHDARFVIFERSGHYPFIEESEEFWQTVATFLPIMISVTRERKMS